MNWSASSRRLARFVALPGRSALVGAPPAAIAPRQIPAGVLRHLLGNEIEAGGSPRMTPGEPRKRHPAAGPEAVPSDRLVGIGRAGRQMPAMKAQERREA